MSTVYELVFAGLLDELGKRTMPLVVLQNCNLADPNQETLIADTTYIQVIRSLGLSSARYFGIINSQEDRFIDLTDSTPSHILYPNLSPMSHLSMSTAETYSVPKPELTLDNSSLIIIPSISQNLLKYASSGANLFIAGFLDEGPNAALGLLKTITETSKKFEIVFSFTKADLDFFSSLNGMPKHEHELIGAIDLCARLSQVLNRHISILYKNDFYGLMIFSDDSKETSVCYPIENFEVSVDKIDERLQVARSVFNATFISAYAQSENHSSSSLLLANAAEAKYLQDGELPTRENMLAFLKSAKFKKSDSPLIPGAHERRRYIIAAK